jgi:hypothetical protein
MKVDEEKAGVKKLDPTSYKRRQPEQGEDALKTSCEAQGGGCLRILSLPPYQHS